MSASIRLRDLAVGYRDRLALRSLSGSFAPGCVTAIVGPNGGGKTTLLKAIVGLLRPARGSIDLPPPGRAGLAYLPQQAELDRSFPIDVLDVVLLGHWRRAGVLGGLNGTRREAARAALATVGLAGQEHRAIGTLSAGQLQRVLFARLMVEDCPIILLDEPFAAVDARTTQDLLALVAGWRTQGRTVLAVLHDLDQVRAIAEHTLLLAGEPIAWGPTRNALTTAAILRAWGVAAGWDDGPAAGTPLAISA